MTTDKIKLFLSNEYLKNYWTGTWYSLLTLFLAWSFQIFRTCYLVFDFSLLLHYCLILGLKTSNTDFFHKSKLYHEYSFWPPSKGSKETRIKQIIKGNNYRFGSAIHVLGVFQTLRFPWWTELIGFKAWF